MNRASFWARWIPRRGEPALSDEEAELDRILADGRLSGRQYDAIEARVMSEVATPGAGARPARSRWLPWAGSALAAAVAAGALLLVKLEGEPALRARGGGDVASLPVTVGCEGPEPTRCALGQTLMFSVPAEARGHLVAYAEPLDAPGQPRIWYFPTAAGDSPEVAVAERTRVLPEGVRLGAPHAEGRYRITAWLHPFIPSRAVEPPESATTAVVEVRGAP